jgi:hypothetical protein
MGCWSHICDQYDPQGGTRLHLLQTFIMTPTCRGRGMARSALHFEAVALFMSAHSACECEGGDIACTESNQSKPSPTVSH